MEYLEANVSQAVLENTEIKPRQKTFVRSFSTKPKGSAIRSGKIFGIIEIKSNHQQVPELIDLIINEIKNNYYFEPGQTGEENLSDHFETALKKTNLAIASFIEGEHINLDLNKINIIMALSHNQELHFTVVGSTTAILFYNTSRTNYRIINILDTTKTADLPPDPLKLFSQIISGRIRPRDILFLGTANILDYFSLEKIKNVITETIPDEGIKNLKQLLENSGSKENFALIALEIMKAPESSEKTISIEEFNYVKAASKDSIQELVKTERETEKLLTPSLLPEIKKYASSFGAAFQNYLIKIKGSTSNIKKVNIPKPNINLKNNIKIRKPNIPKIKIGSTIKNTKKLTKNSANKLKPAFNNLKKISNKLTKNKFWSNFWKGLGLIFGNFITKFKRLPKTSRIFLVVIIILAVLFLQNVVWLGFKNKKQEKIEAVESVITEITTKKNEAEASLIYRDESQARLLLMEARDLLLDLETVTEPQQDQVNILVEEIETKLNDLRHSIKIAEPTQIVNFQNLDGQAEIAKIALLSKNTIYTQNLRNQSLYKANLDTRVLASIFSPEANTGSLTMGTNINETELIFFNESNSTFLLNANNDTVRSLAINITDSANIVDVTSYNNRIYLLDSANNQIYRYSRNGNSFGSVINWIDEELNLDNAVSLTIDGSVYILRNNGEVTKLENGNEVDFEVKVIDPPFKSPTKIKTTDSSNYLYILDPGEKRLVVLNKDGNLISQYTSPDFNNLKDFFVDEANKKIYLLESSKIFGIPAEHL